MVQPSLTRSPNASPVPEQLSPSKMLIHQAFVAGSADRNSARTGIVSFIVASVLWGLRKRWLWIRVRYRLTERVSDVFQLLTL